MAQCSSNGLKTLWEKEKLLVTSSNLYCRHVKTRASLGKGYTKLAQICLKAIPFMTRWFGFETNLQQNFYMYITLLKAITSHHILELKPFPNKPWFFRFCNTSLLKTPWEKEKLLVMRNFSFSLSVFYLFGELSEIFTKFKLSSANTLSLQKSKICRLGLQQLAKLFNL